MLQTLAEKMAENAHDGWAKKKKEELESVGKYLLNIQIPPKI